MSEEHKSLSNLVHDARGPLNKISMHAELIKLILEKDLPKDKAIDAVQKIVLACQECSQHLQLIATASGEKD